jgi:DNA-binding transcriptional LysR family regulator
VSTGCYPSETATSLKSPAYLRMGGGRRWFFLSRPYCADGRGNFSCPTAALEHFVTVAEERNFTRAARRLHLVQSALSVSIRSLERELDTKLFERTTREVRLTDPGRILLPEARRTLDAAASAQAAIFGAGPAGLRGTLRLDMMQTISVIDAGSLIARFHRKRPLVDIRPRAAPGGSASKISDVRHGTAPTRSPKTA